MGVHKENVRQIIHETMPATLSNYMQEIGRAGRDGKDAVAFLLYADGDEQYAKFIATEDLPKDAHIDRFMQVVASGEQPNVLLTRGELSEVAFRVLNYWLQQESPELVKKRMQELQFKKFAEVKHVLKLIESTDCMREQVVQYFGQVLEEKQENCCTNCGIQEGAFLAERKTQEQTQMTTWQQRLQQILLRN